MKNLVSIGKILKTHGFKGQVRVAIDPLYMEDFSKAITSVFIQGLPYFIREKTISTEEQAFLFLEDIETKEAAHQLCGKDIHVPEDLLSEVYEEDPYSKWVGYSVQDIEAGDLGVVSQITEMPQQILLQVMHQGREILIPVNEVFIIKVDAKKKRIETNLPQGYLDIF